jgi:hypothetical protein
MSIFIADQPHQESVFIKAQYYSILNFWVSNNFFFLIFGTVLKDVGLAFAELTKLYLKVPKQPLKFVS